MVGCNELCGHKATLEYGQVITFCIHICPTCNENKKRNASYEAKATIGTMRNKPNIRQTKQITMKNRVDG